MSTALAPIDQAGHELAAPALNLDELAQAWLRAYSSAHTVAAYGRDLRAWLDYCATAHERPIDPLQARRAVGDDYARRLEAEGLKPATVARKLAAVSSFYAYAVAEGLLLANPLAHVRRPRVSDESPTLGLDKAELAAFLEAAREAGPRDYALAGLLGLLGLRVSSACSITAESLGVERGHRVVTVSAKGGKRLTRALPPALAAAIDELATEYPEGPLMRANDGTELDRHDAARIVARLARAAGIGKRISPHSLRHSAATNALDAGVPLHAVADSLGHADARTTQRYDRARRALERDPSYALAAYVAE